MARGGRARFFDDPGVDQLFSIVTAFTAEVSVLAERLGTLERVLQGGKIISPDAIESYPIDAAEAAARAAGRERLIERVFQVLEVCSSPD